MDLSELVRKVIVHDKVREAVAIVKPNWLDEYTTVALAKVGEYTPTDYALDILRQEMTVDHQNQVENLI